jgi:alkylmercury lyase
VEQLAERLLNAFPQLDARERRIALAVYRELARGAPVEQQVLAQRCAVPVEEMTATLRAWPGVFFDEAQRIIGFWGLTIRPMAHRLRLDGRELYAWCAWDTLFLPRLIGEPARVESRCRATGEALALTVEADRVETTLPSLALSFVAPEAAAAKADIVTSFCHHVHFFRTAQAARQWIGGRPGFYELALADAFELGRSVNAAMYGEALSYGPS